MNENEPKSSPVGLVLVILAVAFLSASAGVALWNHTQGARPEPTQSLMVLPESRVIADFRLTDHDGEPFTLANLQDRWSMVFFGFTHCPDVCPSTLYDLKTVQASLEAVPEADREPHQVLFVSVDPERDTPQKMGEYTSYFHPDFIGLVGENEQLAPLTVQLGIAYRIEPHEPGDAQYAVDHSASILLINPDGRLHGVFPAPHDAAKLAADMTSLLAN